MNSVGWSEDIEAKVRALDANIVAEDGTIQRTCKHGVEHVVGHLGGVFRLQKAVSEKTRLNPPCPDDCGYGWLSDELRSVVDARRNELQLARDRAVK